MTRYRCALCKQEADRDSDKYWIRTYCDIAGGFTRFIKITK